MYGLPMIITKTITNNGKTIKLIIGFYYYIFFSSTYSYSSCSILNLKFEFCIWNYNWSEGIISFRCLPNTRRSGLPLHSWIAFHFNAISTNESFIDFDSDLRCAYYCLVLSLYFQISNSLNSRFPIISFGLAVHNV